jgi:hypothetical protein
MKSMLQKKQANIVEKILSNGTNTSKISSIDEKITNK